MHGDPDDVVVTTGAQQALDLVAKTFLDPGDEVVVEAPAYVGALSAFSAYEPRYVQIEIDDDGMIVEHLEDALLRGARPKFVYTVPNFHNPAGVTMSAARRERLVALCREAAVPILEDNPYGMLRFDGDPLPCLRSLDPGNVIYLGTLSKVFSPGVRIGWALAQQSVVQRLILAKEAADLCGSSFNQLVSERYLADPHGEPTSPRSSRRIGAAAPPCSTALEEHFPAGARWTLPAGGFYVWASLPAVHRHVRDAGRRRGSPGGLRAGLRLLRGWPRSRPHAIGVLLSGGAGDRGGDPAARGADRRRGRAVQVAARREPADGSPSWPGAGPPSGRCRSVPATESRQPSRERGYDTVILDPAEVPLVEALAEGTFDACYLALHGKEGEDGTVQRVLQLVGMPFTGTPPFACEIAFDKALAKDALLAAGVRTPSWATIEAPALRDLAAGAALARAIERVGLPCVVKPSRSGSAMGMSFVERESDLPVAVMGALSFSDAAIVEAKVEGVEVAAGIIGAEAEALPLVEIVSKSGVYDYAARYTAGATEYYVPARVSVEVAEACSVQAMRAFEGMGLRDVTRVDLMVDARREVRGSSR